MRATLMLFAGLVLAACDAGAPAPAAAPPMRAGAPRPAATDAERNCLSAVIANTGVVAVSVLGTAAAPGGSRVLLEVPGAAAPWSCSVTEDGFVQEVAPTGA